MCVGGGEGCGGACNGFASLCSPSAMMEFIRTTVPVDRTPQVP